MEKVKPSFRQQSQNNFKCPLFQKKYITIITAAAICLFNTTAGLATTATVRYNSVYQQLEGFGDAACYDVYAMANYSNKEAVYDLLFRDLGLDILRIKNTYITSSSDINSTAKIVAAGKLRNPELKTLLVPWSPAASLKSDGTLGGDNGTLKKDATDPNNSAPYYYVYKAYANWWLNSLTGSGGFFSQGVYPDYISIQNEPDWGIQDQVCRFNSTENSTYAGYDKAFEAVYNKLDGNVSPMPKMLAPEAAGSPASQTYINALISRGQLDNIYGFSHHLYGDGTYDNPDGMIAGLQSYAANYGYKPLFQTEFGDDDGTPTFDHALQLAQLIHNCLVYEGVTSYFHWTLFRDGGYTTGGMINLVPGGSYIIRDTYWFFKHYAYFTDPNWYVIDATPSPSANLRMTAFKNPDNNQLTVVILNKSTSDESLTLTLNHFSPDGSTSEVYRSSSTEHWSSLGEFNPAEALTLPAQSITTIHLTGLQLLTAADAHVTKCNITAGKIQGQDSFDASGKFTDDFDPAINNISQFDVNIISADGNLIYSEANDFTVVNETGNKCQYTHKIPKGGAGAITSLKFDFNKNTFTIQAKNIKLTGLACPFHLNVRLGDYWLSGEVNEPIVNGPKKTIPTRLMKTYDDKLVVTKAKPKHNSTKPLSDSLSVTGEIAVKDINDANMNEPNLVKVDVNIVWGDHTFTIPAGRLVAAKTGHSYKCSKVLMNTNDCNAGFVTAKIDLDKSTFTISVKKADGLDTGTGDSIVPFGFNYGDDDFNETVNVNVVTGRSY
jgi:O-glycosyl hydrolase